MPHWLQSAAAGLNTSHSARACGATHPSPLPAPQIPHGARHEEVTHWLSELQNGETQVWTGAQARGQHPPCPPSPTQWGLPLVLAVENHAVLQCLYPGLQLFHLPSLPAHTSPTKALSHQPVFSSTAGLDSAHAAPSLGLRQGEHKLLSLGDLSWTPKEPLDPSVASFSSSFPTVNAPSHPRHDCYLPLSGRAGEAASPLVAPYSDPARLGTALSPGGGRGCLTPTHHPKPPCVLVPVGQQLEWGEHLCVYVMGDSLLEPP